MTAADDDCVVQGDPSAGYRGSVLEMLRTRKWVGLTVLLVVMIVAFGALSFWQWERAQRDRIEAAPVPLTDVLPAGGSLSTDSYGVAVTASGTYDLAHQVQVKRSDSSYDIVTPQRSGAGESVAVARAQVTSPTDPAVTAVTSGAVTVVGYVQPFEGDPGTPNTLPPGQADRLTKSALALPYVAANGWVALTSQQPAPSVAARPVPAPFGPSAGAPLRLQNVSYAVQWLAFAGFAIFLWWRALRDDAEGVDRDAPQPQTEPVREVY